METKKCWSLKCSSLIASLESPFSGLGEVNERTNFTFKGEALSLISTLVLTLQIYKHEQH